MTVLRDISPGDFLLRNAYHTWKTQPLSTLNHINPLQVSLQAHFVAIPFGSLGLSDVWREKTARVLAFGYYVLYDGALDVLLSFLSETIVVSNQVNSVGYLRRNG